jgi:hypothetical protein
MGVEHTQQQYRQYFDGLVDAQQNLQGNDLITQLKRSQNWRDFYLEFLGAESATQIPAVRQFKANLRRKPLRSLLLGGFNRLRFN